MTRGNQPVVAGFDQSSGEATLIDEDCGAPLQPGAVEVAKATSGAPFASTATDGQLRERPLPARFVVATRVVEPKVAVAAVPASVESEKSMPAPALSQLD